MLAIAAVLAAIAIKRMRPSSQVAQGRSARANARMSARPAKERVERPPLVEDGPRFIGRRQPFFWYETRRRVYSPWIQVMLRIYLVLAFLFSMFASLDIVQSYSTPSARGQPGCRRTLWPFR